MKVTYNWLKDFVDIGFPAASLAKKLTMAGLEVVSLEERLGDFVFEIEVTSNRPDCLSIIGIAREVAAITGKRLKVPAPKIRRPHSRLATQDINIKIEDKKDCPLYTAKVITGVKVGPSPEWLKRRLELVGLRPVNNIVDITNYILFEWGEPLHAFDMARLQLPTVIIRRARSNERLKTIDGQERMLDPGVLVIADSQKPVAAAGIMGGSDTEVSPATQDILLEAAIFNPVLIRRARQRLGLQSEAAYRFERGIDLNVVEQASLSAVALMEGEAQGVYAASFSSALAQAKKTLVSLSLPAVNRVLGADIPAPKVKKVLRDLGFGVKEKTKDTLKITVPTHRQDVSGEVDLIEEVSRIWGFERIPNSLPAVRPRLEPPGQRETVSCMKHILVGLGLQEVITYSLIDQALFQQAQLNNAPAPVEISNPLSNEQGVLRPLLLPSLIQVVAYNMRQREGDVRIFEIAKTYCEIQGELCEAYSLALALAGEKNWWLGDKHILQRPGILQVKGILEALFVRLGIADCRFTLQGNGSDVQVLIGDMPIGFLKKVDQRALERFDIKNKEVFGAEVLLEKVFPRINLAKKFSPFPRYPAVTRDISLELKEGITFKEIKEEIALKGTPLLQEVEIADYYTGSPIASGYKGMTISCRYASGERTLTDSEVNPIHAAVVESLKNKFQATIR